MLHVMRSFKVLDRNLDHSTMPTVLFEGGIGVFARIIRTAIGVCGAT